MMVMNKVEEGPSLFIACLPSGYIDTSRSPLLMTLDHINAACLFVLLSVSPFQVCGGPGRETVKWAMPLSEEQTDVCGCGHFAFVYFCSFALRVLLSMPHGHDQQKNPLLLFTAGHGECGTVHQAKSHRLAGGTGMVRRSAVSYRK